MSSRLRVRAVPVERTRELRRAVLRPHETIEELASGEAPGVHAVAAFDGEQIVAVGLIAPGDPPAGWRIRGMATAPAYRGRGIGALVLRTLLEYARDHGATRVWCNARTPALSLYERAGFTRASAEFELPMIGPHYLMELRNLEHWPR